MQKRKINSIVVKPLQYVDNVDKRPVHGREIFGDGKPTQNCLLIAPKNSGKSMAIAKMVEVSALPGVTTVVVFASTVEKDPVHLSIRDICEDKGIAYVCYTDIIEDGFNRLQEFLKSLAPPVEKDTDPELQDGPPAVEIVLDLTGEGKKREQEEKALKKKKPRKLACDWLLILDDISHQLRSPWVSKLAKEQRHYNMRVIYSSQNLHDVRPEVIKQMDIVCLWPRMSLDKLKKIYRDVDIGVSPMEFCRMYKDATSKPHNFLMCDLRGNKFRKNFDEEY